MEATQAKSTPKYLELSSDELAKVQRSRSRNATPEVDPEWMFIGEFGYYFGFEGIRAILNNEISREVANTLLLSGRKVWYAHNYDIAHGSFVASIAGSRAKKPTEAFTKGMAGYMKASKV